MTKRHAFFNRNALRGLAAVAALGCFQIAHAADVPVPYQSVEYQKLSQVGQWTPLTGATPGGGGVIFSGQPATDVTPKVVESMRLSQSGRDVNASGTSKVPIGSTGKTIPVNAAAKITAGAVVGGLAARFNHPVAGFALMVAAPLLADWLKSAKVGINPSELDYPDKPFTKEVKVVTCQYLSPRGITQAYVDMGASYQWVSRASSNPNLCEWGWEYRHPHFPSWNPLWNGVATSPRAADGIEMLPASMNDIAQYMDQPSAPLLTPQVVHDAITGAGIDPFGAQGLQPSQITVSGPATVPGEKKTTTSQTRVQEGTTIESTASTGTQPATKTTTEATNHNVTYNQNKVTYNTTTTTTTNITNNTTNTTNTTNNQTEVKEGEAPKEEQPDLCAKNPDILACKKVDLDTPDEEIPRTTKALTYSVEDSFGGGACPANVTGMVGGKQMMLYDWAQTCDVVTTYLRPIILLLGAMGALFILIPGRDA